MYPHMHQCSCNICILDVYNVYVSSLYKGALNPDYPNRFSRETGHTSMRLYLVGVVLLPCVIYAAPSLRVDARVSCAVQRGVN